MILILLLAISAHVTPSNTKDVVETGSHKALTKFVKAQLKCGFPNAQITTSHDGREYVVKTEPASSADEQEAYLCIMAWTMDHDKDAPIYVIDAPPK
jgi:hypothetical protein